MKSLRLVAIAFVFLASSAFAWDCPAGQIRVQAPPGTPTTTPYYDVVEGIAFICQPATTPTDPSKTVSSTSSSTSNATGGNATGGSVSNSGNSTNTISDNNNLSQSQKQKQQQSQTQSNSSTNTNNNQSQGGSVSNVGNSVTNVAAPKIPVTSAYAPTTLPSAPCVKNGFGAGVQTMSVGGSFGQGGKIDEGCDAREDARAFFLAGSRLAGCKMLVSTKAAKKAGVTLEDCMTSPEQKPDIALIVPDPPKVEAKVEPVIIQPAPPQILLINTQPIEVTPTKRQLREAGLVKPAVKAKPAYKAKPCVIPDSLKTPMEK